MPMPGWIKGLHGAASRGWQATRQSMQLGFTAGVLKSAASHGPMSQRAMDTLGVTANYFRGATSYATGSGMARGFGFDNKRAAMRIGAAVDVGGLALDTETGRDLTTAAAMAGGTLYGISRMSPGYLSAMGRSMKSGAGLAWNAQSFGSAGHSLKAMGKHMGRRTSSAASGAWGKVKGNANEFWEGMTGAGA